MKKWPLLSLACAVLLAGCAHFDRCRDCAQEGFDPRVIRPPNPLLPNVFVLRSKHLVVDQEPIYVTAGDAGSDGRITISWSLPAGNAFSFSTKEKGGPDGIVFSPADRARKIDAPAGLECSVKGVQGKVFACSFKPAQRRATYKYTVNARDGEKLLEPLDPHVYEY